MMKVTEPSTTPGTPTPSEPLPKPRFDFSFRTRLMLAICGLVLIAGAAVAWPVYQSAKTTATKLTGSLFKAVSNHAASHTRDFVLRAGPLVESLVQLGDHGLALDDPEKLAPQLLDVLEANPGLSWVSYGDENGNFTGAYRPPEGGTRINHSRIVDGKTKLVEEDVQADGSLKVFRTEQDSGYDPRTRPFYLKAKEAGRIAWTSPYVFYHQGVPGISCAAPVKDATGKLRGVISVDFDLNALSEFVAGQEVGEHSKVFVFTAEQVLLAYPKIHTIAAPGQRGEGKLLSLGDTGDSLIGDFRAALKPEHLKLDREEGFHPFTFRHAGVTYLASATAFRIGSDLTWVVGVVAPRDDFIGDVKRSQSFAVVAALVAMLIAIALAAALAKAVSGPVLSIIHFMNRVGGGDLEARADFRGAPEFRRLSGALNQMIGDLRDRLRLRHSLGVAMEVQQRLLPGGAPKIEGLDIAGHSTYCDETGGDYYDFLMLESTSPNVVLVTVGDVMGHGVAAALVMAGVRAVLRDRAAAGTMSDLMVRLNKLLAADHQGRRFMTMYLAAIDTTSHTIRWVSAGHDPALIFDPPSGKFEEIDKASLPLGVMDDTEFEEASHGPLLPGQVIVIGTDGVWEMQNAAGEQFGKDRLRDSIRASASQSAEAISEKIRADLNNFRGEVRPKDDVTFVVLKVR